MEEDCATLEVRDSPAAAKRLKVATREHIQATKMLLSYAEELRKEFVKKRGLKDEPEETSESI